MFDGNSMIFNSYNDINIIIIVSNSNSNNNNDS